MIEIEAPRISLVPSIYQNNIENYPNWERLEKEKKKTGITKSTNSGCTLLF